MAEYFDLLTNFLVLQLSNQAEMVERAEKAEAEKVLICPVPKAGSPGVSSAECCEDDLVTGF